MKHKHCELIKAWADGAEIQAKCSNGQWVDVAEPSWLGDVIYRIKPKVIKYKRFLWQSLLVAPGKVSVCVVEYGENVREPRDQWKGFVRWLDEDWQEVEV